MRALAAPIEDWVAREKISGSETENCRPAAWFIAVRTASRLYS